MLGATTIFEILHIELNYILVKDQHGNKLQVARYFDDNGEYFLNENLEKSYVDEIYELADKAKVEAESDDEYDFMEEAERYHNSNSDRYMEYDDEYDQPMKFTFLVEYFRKDSEKPILRQSTKIAKSLKEAEEKIEKAFKETYHYELENIVMA